MICVRTYAGLVKEAVNLSFVMPISSNSGT